MKRFMLLFIFLFYGFSCLPVGADTLSKSPNHVYIATFNIYVLGNIESRYENISSWDEDLDDSIPDRIANLAKVIAVGGFHIIAIQEVHSGPTGYYAVKDLKRALKQNHNMNYNFFISDYIGQGYRMGEAMAFLYRSHKAKYKRINGE